MEMIEISEKEYRRLLSCEAYFNNSPDLFYQVSPEGKIKDCNRKVTEVLGYTRKELIGKPLIPTIYTKESQKKAKALLARWGKTRKLCYEQLQIKTKSGQIIDVELSVDAVKDKKGKIVYSTSVQRIITECKKTEEALKSLSERNARAVKEWQQTFDASADIISVISPDYKMLKVNRAGYKGIGKKSKDLIGKKCYEVVHGLDSPIESCPCEKTIKTKKAGFGEVMDRGRYYAVTASPILDKKKGLVAFVHTAKDITERKKTEKRLQIRLKYEKLLSSISNQAVGAKDLSRFLDKSLKKIGQSIDVDRAYFFEHNHEADTMSNTYEWTEESTSSQKENLQNLPASAAPWWMDMMQDNEIINFENIEDIPGEEEKKILRAQDIKSILVVPLYTSKGYYGFLGFDECREHRKWLKEDVELLQSIAQTISQTIDRKTAEEELKNTYQQLKEAQNQLIQAAKMAAVGELGAGIAHELNQPLGGIKGFAQIGLRELDNKNQVREDLLEIEEQANHMSKIIRNISTFSRQATFKFLPLDVNEPLKKALILVSQQLTNHNIELVEKLGSDLPQVYADPNQLQQVFLNLISNARDALDSTRKEVRQLTIVTKSISEFVEIDFADTGCGIPKKNLSKIFDPFFTTKSPTQGVGLGLSVTYGIVKDHFGLIDISSTRDRGTVVRVLLPTLESKLCWEIKKCPQDIRQSCPVFKENKGHICWVVQENSCRQELEKTGKSWANVCERCEVYQRKATFPLPKLSQVSESTKDENKRQQGTNWIRY